MSHFENLSEKICLLENFEFAVWYFNQAYHLHTPFPNDLWSTRWIFWKNTKFKIFQSHIKFRKVCLLFLNRKNQICSIQGQDFNHKSCFRKKTGFWGYWIAEINSVKISTLKVISCQFRILMICNKNWTISKLGRRII